MEEENTEELYIDNMLANYMESDFYLANPQQAFPGSMELLKSPDIWIGDTGATNHTTFSKEGKKMRENPPYLPMELREMWSDQTRKLTLNVIIMIST